MGIFFSGCCGSQMRGSGNKKDKGRDFYAILGVTKECSEADLKKAFRKASMTHHPDRNRGNEEAATAKFNDAKEAFDVLSDPKKRRVYDRYGEEGLKEGAGRGEDMRLKMGVELKELFVGSVRRVPMQRQEVCNKCSGAGTTKKGAGKRCTSCGGRGMRLEMRQMGPFVTQAPVECGRCNGEGIMIAPGDECGGCGGRRVIQTQTMLEIPI